MSVDYHTVARSKPYGKLACIQRQTATVLRISRQSVPHLVTNDGKCSVCYFGKTGNYRIWEGYNEHRNKVVGTYQDPNDVIDYLNAHHEK